MKSKHLKKITLNKRSISTLTSGNVKGGATTFEPIKIDTETFKSSYCANTVNDYTCTYCTVA